MRLLWLLPSRLGGRLRRCIRAGWWGRPESNRRLMSGMGRWSARPVCAPLLGTFIRNLPFASALHELHPQVPVCPGCQASFRFANHLGGRAPALNARWCGLLELHQRRGSFTRLLWLPHARRFRGARKVSIQNGSISSRIIMPAAATSTGLPVSRLTVSTAFEGLSLSRLP